ncbi:unnamed protein product, partial [Ectocarpus sp. 8 AP-2014]
TDAELIRKIADHPDVDRVHGVPTKERPWWTNISYFAGGLKLLSPPTTTTPPPLGSTQRGQTPPTCQQLGFGAERERRLYTCVPACLQHPPPPPGPN